jgi:pimeloyl-ACP methyl ester carboxylesterase
MAFLCGVSAGAAEFEIRLEARTSRYSLYELKFPSPHKSPFPVNDTVWGHLYLPRNASGEPIRPEDGGKRNLPAAALVLPIMAAPNAWIETRFVHAFLRRGLAVMWIEMPYQFNRRPDPTIPSGAVFLARSAKRLGKNFMQSRADAGRALTVLENSGLVDPERIGIFGVSLGALVGSSLYSIDDRPKGAVFLLGGADMTDLVYRSEMTGPFIAKAGIERADLEAAWAGLDPLGRREANAGKPVVLVNARSDRVIPAENGRKLAEAFPDAFQRWVPGGHYTAILHMLWMPDYAARHMKRLLE